MNSPPITTISRDDSEYPELLKHLRGGPDLLYLQGASTIFSTPTISIIGSRKMTAYGEKVANYLIPDLVRAGLSIVSGLAYGIDSLAHQIALHYGGKCIAVLGGGFTTIYPASNTQLARTIVQKDGLLVTEYSPEEPPQKYHFPQRNRIVAGLSPMTLILEAGEKSGTLITARHALEAGREVGVVPGDITREESRGVHELLKQGARPITSSADVLALYQPQLSLIIPTELHPALTGTTATLYDLISHGTSRIDQLVNQTDLGIVEVQSALAVLELDGYIYLRGNEWQKI